ncbi:hypothetical protein Tco_1312326 [Tanacetum coccineum]
MSIQDMEDLKQLYLDKMKILINEFLIKDYRDEKIDIKINELKENFNGMSIEINKKKKLQQLEQVANLNTYPSRLFNYFYYDDDDDDDEEYTIAITPDSLKTIYIQGYSIEFEPRRYLATISAPVIDTLLPFSSENRDKVFNHSVLALKEKSPPFSSHRGFKASKLFHHKSPMLIHGENIPILDVPFLHFDLLPDLLKNGDRVRLKRLRLTQNKRFARIAPDYEASR